MDIPLMLQGVYYTDGTSVEYQYDAFRRKVARIQTYYVDVIDRTGDMIQSYRYDVFGNLFTQMAAPYNTIGFTGKTYDVKVSLMDFSARWYSPNVGRFTTADTFSGWMDQPQSLNRYSYVHNNPVNFIDPTGRFIQENERICDCDGYMEPEPTPSPSPGTGGGGSPSTGTTSPYIPQTPEQIRVERMAGYNSVVGDILVDPFGTAIVAGPYVLEKNQLNKHAIVMIHGLADSGDRFAKMASVLSEKNPEYKIIEITIRNSDVDAYVLDKNKEINNLIVILNLIPSQGSPETQAKGLNNLLTHQWFDTAEIDLIGHSMGGLVGYDYLTNPDYIQRNVNNLIAIGSPFDGANLAKLADFAGDHGINPIKDAFDTTGPAYDYLSNKNGYLDELQSRESPLGVNLLTISYYQSLDPLSGNKGSDGIVNFESATRLKNARHFSLYMEGDFFFNIPTPFAHIGMPQDLRIIEMVELTVFD